MRLTPRGPELDHVIKALDQEHPTVEKAARAVIKAVGEVLDLRDWWTTLSLGDGPPILWGVYPSEKEAEKAAATLTATMALGKLIIYPIASVAALLATSEGQPTGDDCGCGHMKALHRFQSSSRGECGLTACPCKKYKAAEHTPPSHPTCITCHQVVA